MALTQAEAESLLRTSAVALQRGDASEAQRSLQRLVSEGFGGAEILFMYAYASRMAGDEAAEEAALDRLLGEQPENIRALIMKGDCLVRRSESRGATSFYRRAQNVASSAGELGQDVRRELQRIDRWLRQGAGRYRDHLERSLARSGLGPDQRSARFQQSLDIMVGEKQVYLQQPGLYYFPELPQRQFYERDEFPWAEALEAKTDAIRGELLDLMSRSTQDFRPYLVSSSDRPQSDYHGLVDNPEWSSFYLWENGGPVEANVARCPHASEAMSAVPLPYISTRAPVVMFSWLKAGARIPPHSGAINARLICHLPLLVPEGCGFRVGNETRQWEEGKLLIFDDTIEHEAWNESGDDRVVLIFDVWRPELSDEERRSVSAMFEAVDSWGAGKTGS